jgi:hypothetical protein
VILLLCKSVWWHDENHTNLAYLIICVITRVKFVWFGFSGNLCDGMMKITEIFYFPKFVWFEASNHTCDGSPKSHRWRIDIPFEYEGNGRGMGNSVGSPIAPAQDSSRRGIKVPVRMISDKQNILVARNRNKASQSLERTRSTLDITKLPERHLKSVNIKSAKH